MSTQNKFNRRNFVKGIGLAAALPLVPKLTLAGNELHFADDNTYKVLTCNIRVALPEDDKAGFGWDVRKKLCAEIMLKQKPDIIGMQEVLAWQNDDLKGYLHGYASFGFDGPEMDQYKEGYHGIAKNPIFYSSKRFELLTGGGYWLSETPLVAGSVSWDTARARNANWVRLKDKKTGRQIRVSNVHLDHQSQPAREKQIAMVLADAAQYQPGLPQILTGDFNSSSENAVHKTIVNSGWTDTYTAISGNKESATVHDFLGPKDPKADKRKKIDFIFTKGGNMSTQSAVIIRDEKNGHYPSDHYFVNAVISV